MTGNHTREGRLDTQKVEASLRSFLDATLRASRFDLKYTISASGAEESPEILVTFEGPDRELLLEHQAELLLALEYIAHRWLHLEPRLHDRVRFDCGDYRSLRLEELKLSARVAAQRVRETGQPFRFNPMPARERRIIHVELNGAAGVRTSSEGSGERRGVVIFPSEQKK